MRASSCFITRIIVDWQIAARQRVLMYASTSFSLMVLPVTVSFRQQPAYQFRVSIVAFTLMSGDAFLVSPHSVLPFRDAFVVKQTFTVFICNHFCIITISTLLPTSDSFLLLICWCHLSRIPSTMPAISQHLRRSNHSTAEVFHWQLHKIIHLMNTGNASSYLLLEIIRGIKPSGCRSSPALTANQFPGIVNNPFTVLGFRCSFAVHLHVPFSYSLVLTSIATLPLITFMIFPNGCLILKQVLKNSHDYMKPLRRSICQTTTL